MEIGVVGLGLIGGSVALNLAQDFSVVGYDADPLTLRIALERRAISRAAKDFGPFDDAKLIFVATPPQHVCPTLAALAKVVRPDAVITDCGSVKASIVAGAPAALGERVSRFVGGHPLAGSERSGILNARRDLFEGAAWALTPTEVTDPVASEMVTGMVTTLGARPVIVAPAEHDANVAVLSHLPHLLAGCLAQLGARLPRPELQAGAWRDLTRIAGAEPELWSQIVAANRGPILAALRELGGQLDALAGLVEAGDEQGVLGFFEAAVEARRVGAL